jgi:hypothetical protein
MLTPHFLENETTKINDKLYGKEQHRHDSSGLHLIIHQHGHHLLNHMQHNTNIK